MRFSLPSIVILVTAFFSKMVLAATPGHDALHCGFSHELETTLLDTYGPVQFDALASKACNPLKCLGLLPAVPCIFACGLNPICIIGCAGSVADKLCPCATCVPGLGPLLEKVGICPKSAEAALFTKVYLGEATDDEKAEAATLGYAI